MKSIYALGFILLGIASPAPAYAEDVHDVKVVPNLPGVKIYVQNEEGLFEPACKTPCTLPLPKGTHEMALSYNSSGIIPAAEVLKLKGPVRLDATYVSRSGLRTGGLILMGSSIVLFWVSLAVATAAGRPTHCDADGECEGRRVGPIFAVGPIVTLATTLIGAFMIFIQDSAHLKATPIPRAGRLELVPMNVATRGERGWATGANPLDGAGVGVRLRF